MGIKFKEFIKNSADFQKTINKIPKKHYNLIKDYNIKFESGDVVSNDKNYIGIIDEKNKIIKISCPWYYSREFTFLHEIAHSVWKHILSDDNVKNWKQICKKYNIKNISKEAKKSLEQNSEEIFCMAYANFYTKHKLKTYDSKLFDNFIKSL